jgi:two-component system sensor histidine kinase YesM
MRYRDILDFRLEAEPEVLGESVPKLSLQPLVENALYHGIKNKRDGGVITVRARRDGGDRVVLEVEDDGAGISPERLDRIRATLEDESDEIRTQRGYGLDNVNKRIRLYYGRAYGLAIESEEGTGTRVSLVVPAVAANGAGPSEGDSP